LNHPREKELPAGNTTAEPVLSESRRRHFLSGCQDVRISGYQDVRMNRINRKDLEKQFVRKKLLYGLKSDSYKGPGFHIA
jgi:hypothetical protein